VGKILTARLKEKQRTAFYQQLDEQHLDEENCTFKPQINHKSVAIDKSRQNCQQERPMSPQSRIEALFKESERKREK